MARKTTIADVARAAGLSEATVDRVVNQCGGVSAGKEAAVLDWARRLGLDRNLDRRPVRLLRCAVLISAPANPFYERLRNAFQRANRLHYGASVQCLVHYVDVLQTTRLAETIHSAARTHDAIIAVCPSNPVVNAAVNEAVTRVPLIALTSDLPDTGRLTFVGVDNLSAGRVAAELMGRFIGPAGGDVIVVTGLQSYVAQEERALGFTSVPRDRFPGCRLAGIIESREIAEQTGAMVAQMIRRHPRIAGIYNISNGNRAIAATLDRLGLTERVVFVAHDVTAPRRKLLKTGMIDAIIDQNPELQAMTAVEVLTGYFGRGEESAEATYIHPAIFLRENA